MTFISKRALHPHPYSRFDVTGVGDIAYYSPWGNMAIFYKDFSYSKGLIKLGNIDGGIEKLGRMQGDFEAVFELAD